MKIEHNSHHSFSRAPFGAAVCASQVRLRITAGGCGWPKAVTLRCSRDGEGFFELPMHYHSTLAGNYVFEALLTLPSEPCLIFYTFSVELEGKTVYYGNNPARRGGVGTIYDAEPIPYQITVYRPDYHTPDWLKHGVMYQIFPDRFAKSAHYDSFAKRSDIIHREWGDTPYWHTDQFGGSYLANDFFGGSLPGIIEKLPYLADLGITVLYLNPIFEAYSNHKYDTGDFESIDPMFGDAEAFSLLCREAEKHGIKVILDGVFNHTGSDSKYFNKSGRYPGSGACQSVDSPYYSWYRFTQYPDSYESWWGIATLPQVDEDNPSYREYMLSGPNAIVKRWLRAGAAGWRLDVADELPDSFIAQLRREAKTVKPDAAIIGEVWEDASNKTSYGSLRKYLGGDELDSAMNYPLREAILLFVKGAIDGGEFSARIMSLYENYPREAFYAMMNFLGSHDTPRILTALSDAPDEAVLPREAQAAYRLSPQQRKDAVARLRLAVTLQMCLPGIPSIFYGDEAGVEGYGDPFCRACFPWDAVNEEIHRFCRQAIARRKGSAALLEGSFEMVYGEGSTCGLLRCAQADCKLVMANTSPDYEWHAPVELGRFGITELVWPDDRSVQSPNGRFELSLPPLSALILDATRTKAVQN